MIPLPERITMDTAADALTRIGAASGPDPAGGRHPQPAAPLELDLAGLREFDSAALALLIELRRGRPQIALRNVPPNLRKLAALYGVDEMLLSDR